MGKKKKKKFVLLKILIAVLALGIIMLIVVPIMSKYKTTTDKKNAYIMVSNIVNSIKTKEDGNCFYDFNYKEDNKYNINGLIILKNEDTYSVYAEMDKKVLISVNKFKNTNKNKESTWVSKDAFETLATFTEEDLFNLNVCTNLYDEK